MNAETLLTDKFINFLENITIEELEGMCAARENIFFHGGEFYTFPRGIKDYKGGAVVYDSEGQADVVISPGKLKEQMIEDAEFLLQRVFLDEPSYEN